MVTSRQHCIRGPTLAWVEQHFPGVFAEVHFGNHWALEGTSKAKSEICRRALPLLPAQPCMAPACMSTLIWLPAKEQRPALLAGPPACTPRAVGSGAASSR